MTAAGDSLCYAFLGFDNDKSCEEAYFKMNNVLIDDRRIKVGLQLQWLALPLRSAARTPICSIQKSQEFSMVHEETVPPKHDFFFGGGGANKQTLGVHPFAGDRQTAPTVLVK
jgi:RNA recognition motif-containing protein